MTENVSSLTVAATAVMQAIEPLSQEDRERVLRSAAALYGVGHLTNGAVRKATVATDGGVREQHEDDRSKTAKRLSVVEFLDEKQPATNTQRIAAFAYYREHIEGQGSTFARADLQGYFATAKLPKPGNYDRDWNNAVREGWIHDDGADSYLTQKGEESVETGFDGKGRSRGATAPKRGRRTAKPVDE